MSGLDKKTSENIIVEEIRKLANDQQSENIVDHYASVRNRFEALEDNHFMDILLAHIDLPEEVFNIEPQ